MNVYIGKEELIVLYTDIFDVLKPDAWLESIFL